MVRIPAIRLRSWLIVLGWILVIGGIVEGIELLFHDWPHTWWRHHGVLHAIVSGPIVQIGLGSALWALARR